jgi:hypothetical protein
MVGALSDPHADRSPDRTGDDHSGARSQTCLAITSARCGSLRLARAFLQLLPFEMAILGLVEFGFMFALTFMMLTSGGQALLQSADLPHDCLVLAAMLALTIAGTAATIGLYRPEVCLDRRRFLQCGTIAALLAFPAILLVSGACRMTLSGEHVAWLARLLIIWLPTVLLVRFCLTAVASWMPVSRRVLIVGSGTRAMQLRRRLTARRHGLFEPILANGGLAAIGAAAGAETAREISGEFRMPRPDAPAEDRLSAQLVRDWRVWGIVIAEDVPAPHTHDALLDNKLRGIPVYSDLAFQERHLGRIELDAIDANWLLFAEGFQNGAVSRAVKRVIDVAVGLLLTLVTLPLMVMTAVVIRLESRGPVFYRQERTGLHGETLRCSSSAAWRSMPRLRASRNGRPNAIHGSPGSAPSCGPAGSTNCRSCSTCYAAK